MASVDTGNNPNDPNNPNNQPGNITQPGGQTNQPATTSGAGGVTATGAGNVTGQVAGTANPSQPFQNIASYLSANAQGGQQLAGQVAGQVSAPINEASTGITKAGTDFTKSVNAGYTPENKDLITAVSDNPAYVVSQNPENVTNFLSQLNNKYTGPSAFEQQPGYADLQAKIAGAQSAAANTKSESGIQTLLKGVEGPTTAGINKLDSLLLSTDPTNYKTIQEAGKGADNLLPTLNQTTADQNALAANAAKVAPQTAAEARAALDAARGRVGTNLTDEQNTIQGIVNEYNKSVGVINPVVQDITSAIQNFLASNPNIKFSGDANPMAALQNIASIVMPEEAAYASPQDYAQIAALVQLGDTQTGGLPINPSTSSQAQSWQIPTQLIDAVGKAPGVEQALQDELAGFGNQINSAVAPFTKAEEDAYNWAVYGQPAQQQAVQLQKQLEGANQQLKGLIEDNKYSGNFTKEIADLQAKIPQLQTQMAEAQSTASKYPNASWDAVAPIARGLQWVDPAETSYRSLIDSINASLGKLGSVGVPTLTYGPNTVTDPVTGVPIGKVGKEAGNAAAIGTGAGAVGAAATPALAAPAIAESVTAMGGPGALDALGLSPAQAAGPAALAAYGTSNIIQNSLKNPIQSGIMSLANTGLSLATLSLPPQIFKSIGKDINKVINSIGDFFGGLF